MPLDVWFLQGTIAAIRRRHVWPGIVALAAAVALALVGLGADAQGDRPHLVEIQLLGVNDLHANLEPPDGQGQPGGAANLAGTLDRAAADYPGRTVRVHAGDMVGASPLVSSHFHDEPTMEAMKLMGFDVGTFGNHEFDEGSAEALRLVRGGRRSGREALKPGVDGRLTNTSRSGFPGAGFPYVSANVADAAGRPLAAPYRVVRRAGVELGIIGVTTLDTPKWLLPRHARGLRFRDISDSVDRFVPALQRRGVEAIVVLAHAGGPMRSDPPERSGGEVISEAAEMDDAVDIVVSGHSHTELNESVANSDGEGDKLIVQAKSYGRAFGRVKLTIDRRSGEVVAKSAEIEPVTAGTGGAPRVAKVVRRYQRAVAPLAQRVIGRATETLHRGEDGRRGDLGEVVADAQRGFAGADVAFVDQTTLRDDLKQGEITYADASTVHGYESDVMRLELGGAAILELVEQEDEMDGSAENLYASGLTYGGGLGWPFANGTASIELADGRLLQPDRTYSVAANELLVSGDRFPAFGLRVGGLRRIGTDREALAKWFGEGGRCRSTGCSRQLDHEVHVLRRLARSALPWGS